MIKEVDILIVGGGLTGATLVLALRNLGISTLLVDAKPLHEKITPHFDARSLALSPASQRILSAVGIWERIQEHSTAIELIHVSDQHHFGTTRLQARKNSPLGYVVEMHHLTQAVLQQLKPAEILVPATVNALDLNSHTVTLVSEGGELQIRAKLIVAADGANSTMRVLSSLPAQIKNYAQQAIVANIGLQGPHAGRAYERFTADGPLALLPMSENRMSLVWTLPPNAAKALMALSEDHFLQKLQRAFGYRLGRFAQVGARSSFPLQLVVMPQQIKNSLVFIGNAAHTLHPVAGQGFNLGLRDVATLAQCIAKHGINAPMLQQYVSLRTPDQKAIIQLTDGLIKLFTNRFPGLGFARGLGLIALDNIPMLKNMLARYARGFGGIIPDLVCEMGLSQPLSSAIERLPGN